MKCLVTCFGVPLRIDAQDPTIWTGRIEPAPWTDVLLGPLIVEPVFRSQGIGEALVTTSLEAAKAAGWKLVILVGDEPYYVRMGFQRAPKGRLSLPGPVDPERLLYCELEPDALAAAKGPARGA